MVWGINSLLVATCLAIKQLLYSRKAWWVESLANLANRLQFAKLHKIIQISSYNLINLWLIYSFAKLFSAKHFKRVNLPNFLPPKLSCYAVTRGLLAIHIHGLHAIPSTQSTKWT